MTFFEFVFLKKKGGGRNGPPRFLLDQKFAQAFATTLPSESLKDPVAIMIRSIKVHIPQPPKVISIKTPVPTFPVMNL